MAGTYVQIRLTGLIELLTALRLPATTPSKLVRDYLQPSPLRTSITLGEFSQPGGEGAIRSIAIRTPANISFT